MPDPAPAPAVSARAAATDDDALATLAAQVDGGRALVIGPPGCGKSTLVRRLAAGLVARGHVVHCVGADPGSPAFGAPGAVSLATWARSAWRVLALEAVCSLDAGRFRQPLVDAVRRLLSRPETTAAGRGSVLLVDGPGVVRGVAGAELCSALLGAVDATVVVRVDRGSTPPLLAAALRTSGRTVVAVDAPAAARRPGKASRARTRTARWDAHLADAGLHRVDPRALAVTGTPPPLAAPAQWMGRQVAVLAPGARTRALGEIVESTPNGLSIRAAVAPAADDALLVRDARRDERGMLGTAGPDAADAVRHLPPADLVPGLHSPTGPRPMVRAGALAAVLVNGVLGDPLLHIRLQHRRRSLLLDAGEAGRLPARIAHQVSDLFLTHAHMDHIGGFPWLIRARLGVLPALRVFGPSGTIDNIRGLLAGFLWDRIGDRGPRFEVAEVDGERLTRVALRGGAEAEPLPPARAIDGVLVDEADLRVRAVALDHGFGTRVLAFAVETPAAWKVRKERLTQSGLTPGPWLTELKSLVARGEQDVDLVLPNGRRARVGDLADQLLIAAAGTRLVYATDLADTEANRRALGDLAAGAHTLFCEASFRRHDADQARRTGHLTTDACAAIAARAGVERLIPFHFSRRYERELAAVYDELREGFSRTITPPSRELDAWDGEDG
ncbi:MAG: MBL fold metallo-hydrolase [Ectothiorhodospiraceae bacterium]|nr:MBL fold metallo-hydrolase [Ectothiorhodospiraceae bacterium]